MLKLEKGQYLNFILQLNYTRYQKRLKYKNFQYENIYKFESQHFLLDVYFSFKLKKNSIKNKKFYFLTKICIPSIGNF